MAVTTCANGLTIIHKDSGGEASATLPDVCLTTMGNSVVPIPYGNNAKASDLVDGTKTITMDGGNSVAIKGSTFSKSTGDDGGDKKGISSGTIQGEAAFISSSSTVKFEGKGVCRLSDQLTMNNGNTLCMGGALVSSVTVTPEDEGTYINDLSVTYSCGEGFQAPYCVIDSQGTEHKGTLNDKGRAEVTLPVGAYTVEYGEDQREYTPRNTPTSNPDFVQEITPQHIIDKTKGGLSGFWEGSQRALLNMGDWGWGVLQGDFNQDPTAGQLMLNTALSVIPYVDQAMDTRDIGANLLFLSKKEEQDNPEAWLNLVLSCIGAIPTLGSVLKGVSKAAIMDATRDELFAMLRQMGRGNVDKFLANIDWKNIQAEVLEIALTTLTNFNTVLVELSTSANAMGYTEYATRLNTFNDELTTLSRMAEQRIPDSVSYLSELVMTSMKKGKSSPTSTRNTEKSNAESGANTQKVHEDNAKKSDDTKCWLCEKPAPKKNATGVSDVCKKSGFNGKYYNNTDKEYGFTKRGTKRNKHYPWILLGIEPKDHALYARCYDQNVTDNSYTRPKHIWKKTKERNPSVLQAHHIITIKQMKIKKFLMRKLPSVGYDINAGHNITVLPGIPELACFYQMPLHSGPHSSSKKPSLYVMYVAEELGLLENKIKRSSFCDKKSYDAAKLICKEMKEISKDILESITLFEKDGALNVYNHDVYKQGNFGCCNQLKHSDIEKNKVRCIHRIQGTKHVFKTFAMSGTSECLTSALKTPQLEGK
jgi:hypothetical protein